MMMIVRLYPKGDKQKLWDCVLPILREIKSEHYRPLYLSQWEPVEFTTVMIDVGNLNCMHKLFTQELSKCDEIERSRTLTLMSPHFFPVPKERPQELHRYRIAVQVDTALLEQVYQKISDIDYSNINIFPTYQAYSFGEDDILLSVLAENEEGIDTFIQDFLAPIEGIRNVEYIWITQSLRIAPKDFWREYRKKLYKIKVGGDKGEIDDDFDWSRSDVVGITGGFVDEF